MFLDTEPFRFGRPGVECYCQHESGAAVIQLQFLINEVGKKNKNNMSQRAALFLQWGIWHSPVRPLLSYKVEGFVGNFVGNNVIQIYYYPPPVFHLSL